MKARETVSRLKLKTRFASGNGPKVPGPRVLSLKQPWAWAVAVGKKKVENRTWNTTYRGTVFIHASTKLDRAAVEWLREEARVRPPSAFVHGAVVAVADIIDVVTKRDAAKFAPWFFGPYGFVLDGITPLRTPVPEKGRLGLAHASRSLQRRVSHALRAGATSSAREGR